MTRLQPLLHIRFNSSTANIYASRLPLLLSTAAWSVRSLLSSSDAKTAEEITPLTLQHLLRLSALPPPETLEKEKELLAALQNHLHFVRAIQEVDVKGVEPLARIGDEVEPVAVKIEDVIDEAEREKMLNWKPLNLASKKMGNFYVVDAKAGEEDVLVEEAETSKENEK